LTPPSLQVGYSDGGENKIRLLLPRPKKNRRRLTRNVNPSRRNKRRPGKKKNKKEEKQKNRLGRRAAERPKARGTSFYSAFYWLVPLFPFIPFQSVNLDFALGKISAAAVFLRT
jgi:hypothetical protein